MKHSPIKELWSGVLLVAVFSLAAIEMSQMHALRLLGISPLLIGILIGILYAFTLRNRLSAAWMPGVLFCAKRVLRLAIVLYGFRLTIQQVMSVGIPGFLASFLVMGTTLLLGCVIGIKLFKIDRDTSILVAVGSAICGAAAVLAAETVLDSKPYKTAVAVATVVVFGTLSMFAYPLLHALHWLPFEGVQYGLFTGATVHEVAQVVAAASAVPSAEETAVIVKLTRVLLLAPTLLILGFIITCGKKRASMRSIIPWFAFGFIAVVAFHSLHLLPSAWVARINTLDTFLLTMAMTALGMETNAEKFKASGWRPMGLAALLMAWLFFFGLAVVMVLS